jgi:putative ABC transport system permease protein
MILTDVRHALRSLRKSPGFVTVAILALAIGLGLSTTMFAVLDAVVNPPQPYRSADRLFNLYVWANPREKLTPADLIEAVRSRAHSFDAVLRSSDAIVPIESRGGASDALVRSVTPDWFRVLGLRPAVGRTFARSDGDNVAILSHWMWRRLAGWGGSLAGAHVTIGDRSYAVVGVMSSGASATNGPAAWLRLLPADELHATGRPIVRLRPGVTVAQASSELHDLVTDLIARYGARRGAYGLGLGWVRQRPEQIRDIHKAMVGAALVVLLIACVNLAHLMLARGIARRRELALRMALGAGRPPWASWSPKRRSSSWRASR